MTELAVVPAERIRFAAVPYGMAAGIALALGLIPLIGLPCELCGGGLLSAILPWAGAAFYGIVAVVAARRPGSAVLPSVVALTVFAHADLMAESVSLRRLCWGCIAIAALVFGAALVRGRRRREERMQLLASLVLGAAASFFAPFEHVDYALTRAAWPAQLLNELPVIVSREEAFKCDHGRPARLLLYERNCGG